MQQDTSPATTPESVPATPAPTDDPSRIVPEEGGSAIGEVLQFGEFRELSTQVLQWVQTEVLTINMAFQIALILAAFVPAVMFGPKLKRLIYRQVRPKVPAGILRRACDAFATVATMIALWIALSLGSALLSGMNESNAVIDAVQSLLTAAIFIRLVTLVIRSPFWSKVAFYVAWPIAAMDAFGILDNVVSQLQAASIPIGENSSGSAITLSALDVVRAGIIFAIFFWIASLASGLINRQIQNVDELNPSFKALLSKVLNFAMPIVALVLALNMIGFNLASLAVFSGAVGLGIGLGLQKIIANFLAGFTLLADKSIKPGDVIEVDGTYGWVTDMKSRYVSVRTRDGHENLIPNAVFIDEGVVNWSHSDNVVRVHAPFGITYDTRDLRKVQEMAIQCAVGVDRVVETPKPVCLLTGFGESSVDFDLRFWITDPSNGIGNIKSEVMVRLWDALHDAGIEIPFKQVDLHVKSAPKHVLDALPQGADSD